MAEQVKSKDEIREAVRERYAEAASSVGEGRVACCGPRRPDSSQSSCGCGVDARCSGAEVLVRPYRRPNAPREAKLASLGCGNPTAVADLHDGEVVLDLGSGGGEDVFLSAARVGPAARLTAST